MIFVAIGVGGYLLALALVVTVMVALGRAARHADTTEARYLAQQQGLTEFADSAHVPQRAPLRTGVARPARRGLRRVGQFVHLAR